MMTRQPEIGAGERGWGWLPPLSFSAAFGTLLVACADNGARQTASWAEPLFWSGLVVLYAPIAIRQTGQGVSRTERIGLLVLLGLALYVVKLLHSPLSFTLHDEFAHWRTAHDILTSRDLFSENPLQPVSALYPGLEMVTVALSDLSGLSIFASGTLLIAVARLLCMLALYLLYEKITGSSWMAGVAGVAYAGYPNYLFWSAQYAYESLALPLAVVVLLVTTLGAGTPVGRRARAATLSLALVIALIATHHLTSLALAACLLIVPLIAYAGAFTLRLLWRWITVSTAKPSTRPLVALLAGHDPLATGEQPSPPEQYPSTLRLGLTALVLVLAWQLFSGRDTVEYVAPHLQAASIASGRVLVGAERIRMPFSGIGASPPGLERVVAYTSVGLILAMLPFGVIQVLLRWGRHPLALTFAVVACLYPVTLPLRLTSSAAEISNRLTDWLFVAVPLVLAAAAWRWLESDRATWLGQIGFGAVLTLIFLGAVVIGMPPWARLPGPYLVAGDTRGIQAEGVTAAEWFLNTLGPNHRLIGDRSNLLLLGSYGGQHTLDGLGWIFFEPTFEPIEASALRERGVEYVVVDRRVTSGLPLPGFYYETGEPDAGRHRQPIAAELLEKFDSVQSLDRTFDNGDIRIYAVQE